MEIFRRDLLICCCVLAAAAVTTVCGGGGGSEDAVGKRNGAVVATPNSANYEDDIAVAEDHEHHRIVIVVPKEVPQHVNHVHTYKLSGKGIPLIHSGKVVHDHKHSGKVAHEHGHAGQLAHNHKHAGIHGHQHKHFGYLGHNHFGGGHNKYFQQPAEGYPQQSSDEHLHQFHNHQLLRTAAHNLRLQNHQTNNNNYLSSQASPQHGGFRPTSGQVQYVPSSQPHGLGSFMPSEIQQFMDGRQEHRNQHQQHQHQYPTDDGEPPSALNVIRLRVPDQHGPNFVKHVDIDLTNNVARLQQTGDKQQQPVTSNFKAVTQFNKVIGHGRAKPPENEFDSHADDEDNGGGSDRESSGGDNDGGGGGGGGGSSGVNEEDSSGEVSAENVQGYRFGEGYRLAMDAGLAREYSSGQDIKDVDDLEEFRGSSDDDDDDVAAAAVLNEDGDQSDTNAYSHSYSLLHF